MKNVLSALKFTLPALLLVATFFLFATNGGQYALFPAAPDATAIVQPEKGVVILPPPPWAMSSACGSLQDANIGSVTGSATYDACDSDTISISANNVPSATADKQYSVQREVCGDGEVIVKVLSVSGGLAGLELRADNAPGAIKVGLRTALGTSVQRFVRTSTDGSQSSNNTTALGHQWLKLVRSGSSVSTYTSTNGSTWNFAASYTVSLPTCVQASLLVQSVNVNTTHTGVFKDLQFSSFTAPAGDTTTVAFDQDTISANAGDTVMICVNIANPCDCSPTEVDVELQGSASPHLTGYTTETLVFDDTSSQKCFSLSINGAWGDHNYTFSLQNISGGNGAEAGNPENLVIEVDGDDPPVPFCGVLDSITFDSALTLDIVDRFGNAYPIEYIKLPEVVMGGGESRLDSVPGCGCSEFDISTGYFNIYFEDCIYTESGFNDPVLGADRRRVVCQVFSEIADTIVLQTTGACDELVREVNVRILPSQVVPELGLTTTLDSDVLGVATPYGRPSIGLSVGFPWLIINAADVPATFPSPDNYHGTIRINFEDDVNASYWYGTGSGPSSSSGLTDLYTVVWHEALHMLDFRSSILGNVGAYTLYDQYLRFIYSAAPGTLIPIIEETPGEWPFWIRNMMIDPGSDFYKSCQDIQSIIGPDLYFEGTNDKYPVLSNNGSDQLMQQSHSHLNANCDATMTPDYLMSGFLPPETRRQITTDELDIMCTLGYHMGTECGCTVAGVEDFGPDCETRYEVDMCDSLTIYVDDLVANDHPDVTGISELFLLTPLYGELTWQPMSSSYLFKPNRPGLTLLGYTPTGCDGRKGNFTLVYVRVKVSDDCIPTTDCEVVYDCENEPIFPACQSFEDPFCDKSSFCNNLLCNPGFCNGMVYGNFQQPAFTTLGVIDPPFMILSNPFALLPGWYRSHGTPDLLISENSSTIRLGANDLDDFSEGVWTLLAGELIEGRYLFGVYLENSFTNTGTLSFHADLVEANELEIPGDQSILPPYSGTSTTLLDFSTDVDITDKILASCIEINPSDEDALRLYLTHDTEFGNADATLTLDYVELMRDDFTAGEDTTIIECPDTVLLGNKFCMISGITIRYEWFELDESDDPILPAIASCEVLNNEISNINGAIDPETHLLSVSPLKTTTYRLVRTVENYGTVHESFELCLGEDDVVVTVYPPEPDASFTYYEEDCLWYFTSNNTAEDLEHNWVFGVPGPTSDAMNPSGILLSDGMVIVTHTVTNLCLPGVFRDTITVTDCCEFPFPTVDFDAGALIDSCGVYRFRINSTSEGVNSILWNVNGTTSDEEEFDYTFPDSGTFPFTLTLTNLCGQVRIYSDSIEVKIRDAAFTPTIFCLNTYFEPAYTVGGIHSWTFGDGNDSNGVSPQHTYEEAGVYTVIHEFTDTICDRISADTLMITLVECDTTGFDCPCDSPYNIDASMLDDGEVLLSNLINTGTLPAGFLANTCLALNGRLIVDVDYTFLYIEGRMQSGAEMVVQPTATLALSSVTQNGGLHGCEEMWRGIRVFGSGGGLLRSKGSIISDAQYAVHALDKSTIDIQGTTFTRNYIGIFFNRETPGAFNLLPFSGNTFDGEENLLTPYSGQTPSVGDRPFTGIFIRNCNSPIHIGTAAIEPGGINTFRDIHNGILTENTPLSVERSIFENVVGVTDEPNYAFTGFGIRHEGGAAHLLKQIGLGNDSTDLVSFANCTNAIWARGTHADITQNKMEEVDTGVRLELCTERVLIVENNLINAKQAGVYLFQNAPATSISVRDNNISLDETSAPTGAGIRVEENALPHPASSAVIDNNGISLNGPFDQGIRISSATSWEVTNNRLKLEGLLAGINVVMGNNNWVRGNTVAGNGSGYGINVNASGDIRLECNTVQGFEWGLSMAGNNSGADVVTTLFRIPMVTGLRYTNGILAPIQNGRGNRWEGTAEDYGQTNGQAAAVHEGNDIGAIQSNAYRVFEPYDVGETVNTYPPSIALPNAPLIDTAEWFQPYDSISIICTEQPQLTEEEEQLNLAHRIAKDSINHFPAGTVWDAKWGLYQKLLENPALMTEDTILSNFFDEEELNTLGQLIGIEQTKTALFDPTTETEAIASFVGELDSLIQLIRELDSLIVTDSITIMPSEREEWFQQANQLVDTVQQLSHFTDSLRLLEIEELIEENEEISAITRPEKNQRTVNKLYLDVLAKGNLSFTQPEKDTLTAIAIQCPEEGGRAVFVARAMRAYFADSTYVETESCADSISAFVVPQGSIALLQESLKPQHEGKEATVRLFPNPAGDYVMISHGFSQTTQLLLYDAYGKIVKVVGLPNTGQLQRISTSDMASGVYIVSIVPDNAEVVNLRLLIVK